MSALSSYYEETQPVSANFEDHINNVAKVRDEAISSAIYKQLGLTFLPLILPILALSYILNYMPVDIITAISTTIATTTGLMWGAQQWQNRATSQYQGKKVLVLTYRLKRGDFFSDFAPIEAINKIEVTDEEIDQLKQIVPELSIKIQKKRPEDQIVKLEYVFFDFPYFRRMIVYSEVDDEGLLVFTTQTVLVKSYLVQTIASPIDVTNLRTFKYGAEWIPHVVPTGSDYHCENVQSAYNVWTRKRLDVERGMKIYDEWIGLRIMDSLMSRDAEIGSVRKSLKDSDDKTAKMAADAISTFLEVGQPEKEPKFNKKNLMKALKWITIITAIVSVTVIVLYWGYIFPPEQVPVGVPPAQGGG